MSPEWVKGSTKLSRSGATSLPAGSTPVSLISGFLLTASLLLLWEPSALAFEQNQPVRSPRLWGNMQPGRYKVGLRFVTFYDSHRIEPKHTNGRPIEIALWYPALASRKNALTLAEYLSVSDISRESVVVETSNDVATMRRKLAICNDF